MWKVSGRSSALERAQALLSARRSSRGDGGGGGGGGGSNQDSPTKTQGGSFKTRSVPPNSHTLFSDLSDLCSDSVSERGADAPSPANAREKPGKKDVRPQSPLGEGSRFLKKAPKPANSSHSPVSRNQAQPGAEPRYASSPQRGSQAPALLRLAEIESRVRSRRQELERAKQATASALGPTSDVETSPAAAVQNTEEAPVEPSAQSDGDQRRKGNRFLKKRTAGGAERAGAARPADAGVGSTPRAAGPVPHSGGLERTPRGIMSGGSLESDEEDMKKLLGDSTESFSALGPGRESAVKRPHRTPSSPSERGESPAPPAAAHPSSPSSSAPARSPASPSHRRSPFRFSGQAKARFSPSVLSPSPSPPAAPPSHPGRLQRSHSSSSSRAEVLSLEELFPVEPEDPHSRVSSVSSEDFKINVMTLDELIPAFPGTASDLPAKQKPDKVAGPVPGSHGRRQHSPQEEEEEEVVPDYQSDFDSDSSSRQISEHLGDDDDDDDGAEVRSEVRHEVAGSERSRTNSRDYSSVASEPSYSSVSRTSDRSQRSESLSRGRTSLSHSGRSSPQPTRRRASTRRDFKDAAVQTRPGPLADSWAAGTPPPDPTVSSVYMKPAPTLPHTVGAERLEAISSFDPARFALNEVLKQQLAMTRQFVERSEYLHSCLLRSLEPPDYRYTTLEETLQNIRKRRHPKATVEKP